MWNTLVERCTISALSFNEKKRLTTVEKINIAIELSGLILTIIGLIHTW